MNLRWIAVAVISMAVIGCPQQPPPVAPPADTELKAEVAKLKADAEARAKADADAKTEADIEAKVQAEFAKARADADKSTGRRRC